MTLRHAGQTADADEAFRQAISIHRKLLADFPTTTHYGMALLRDYRDQAMFFWACGRFREAEHACRQVVEFGKTAAIADPGQCDLICRFLVTCPDQKCWNAPRARELAQNSTTRDSRNPDSWNTLAIAHYRSADYSSALAALEKAKSLRPKENAGDDFFFAMTCWQRHDPDQARMWYQKAIQCMDKDQSEEEELRLFRAEASALLGIKED